MGALEHLAMASNVVTMLGGLFTASLFLIWWFTSISDEANMFDEEAVGTTRELDQFNSYWTNLQATNSNPVVGISAQSMAAAVKKVADTYREFTSRLADSDAANLSKGQLFWQEHTSEGLRKRWRWIKHRTFLEKRVVLARNMKYQLIFKYIHLLTKYGLPVDLVVRQLTDV